MEATRLASRRLASTAKRSRPFSADIAYRRPGSSGLAVPGFRLEAACGGREAGEHSINNGPPQAPEPEASTLAAEQPTKGERGHRGLSLWVGALGTIAGLFVLLALVGGSHDHRTASPPRSSEVGMPTTLPGNVPVKPLRIAVVLGDGFDQRSKAREMQTLEGWLSGHVNPATRLTIVDSARHLTTASLRPSGWRSTMPAKHFHALDDLLRRTLGVGRGHRVIVTFDHPDPISGGDLARLHLKARAGAPLPASVALLPGRTITAAVDPGETHAFANATAKAVISISRMAEGEEE